MLFNPNVKILGFRVTTIKGWPEQEMKGGLGQFGLKGL
jgi:hypothetical protein